jgi:hypothetical protein|tara:strand:+ start:378 stop:674 length:297 start_codon:yes stop_codon:yes gene_type:complete
MSIQGPISSFSVTAAASNATVYSGPARILGVYFMNDVAQGTIVLYDDATEVFKIQIPDGSTTENSNYIEFPGDGIRVDTSLKYTFSTIKYGTILFQKG